MKIYFLASILALAVTSNTNAQEWEGEGEVGLVKASGNTESENFNIGLNFKRKSEAWEHEIDLDFFQNSADGEDTASSSALEYVAKKNLSDRSYLFGGLSYLDDDFDGFTEQSGINVGYGYHVIDNKKVGLELGAGPGYRDTSELIKLDDGTEVEGKDLSGPVLVLKADYRNQITSNTKFVDSFKAELGSDNSYVENDASIIVSMNEKFSLKAGIKHRHNSDPAAGSDKTDTITSFNLLYNF